MPQDEGAPPDLDRLVRRLRSLTARGWREHGREAAVRQLLADLAAVSAPGRPTPAPSVHALADAVAVVARDAWLAGAGDEAARGRVAALLVAALAGTS